MPDEFESCILSQLGAKKLKRDAIPSAFTRRQPTKPWKPATFSTSPSKPVISPGSSRQDSQASAMNIAACLLPAAFEECQCLLIF
ncbi:hypothetical protein V5799_011433 [Amblyomma americanum]|uniref:Uncharacterized protein n=1 Tax=Amblyomma americanum TaxID=6943 RepID=A0AAQ4EH68_AMBAM